MPTIIFSHGQESSPKSTKIQYLSLIAQRLGHTTKALDYRSCDHAEERVALLREHLESYGAEDIILVGSSMGGYVSTVVAGDRPIAGLFLMAPALYLPRYEQQEYQPQTNHITLAHGWQDIIIPYQNSVRFGQEQQAQVHLMADDHRLAQSQKLLEHLFKHFLEQLELL